MELQVVLPIVAAMVHIVAYGIYNIQTQRKEATPNPASWLPWAFLAILNALSFSATNGVLSSLQFFAGSVGGVFTFFAALITGHFMWPNRRDWIVMVGCIAAIVVWRVSSPINANILLGLILAWSFEPTLRGVFYNPLNEKPLAWQMWTFAFAITAVNTYLYNGGWTLSMFVPFVGIVGHGAVAVLCRRSRRALLFV